MLLFWYVYGPCVFNKDVLFIIIIGKMNSQVLLSDFS